MGTMHVASVVEQCWHKVPGGTARATVSTLDAMTRLNLGRFTGIAARHRTAPQLATPQIPIVYSRLPRPALYESWHRLGRPRVESMIEDRIDMSGTQVIGWDPAANTIRSWVFDSDGGITEGVWTRRDDGWSIRAVGVLPDGRKASMVNIIRLIDDNTFTWQSVGREVDGELLPNIDEVTVIRK
ncbi:MAG: hypothetical protein IH940_11750 [Acidobacteria bacterium]|nr:hypothetical protein [Acidobacteriota bacterium]